MFSHVDILNTASLSIPAVKDLLVRSFVGGWHGAKQPLILIASCHAALFPTLIHEAN